MSPIIVITEQTRPPSFVAIPLCVLWLNQSQQNIGPKESLESFPILSQVQVIASRNTVSRTVHQISPWSFHKVVIYEVQLGVIDITYNYYLYQHHIFQILDMYNKVERQRPLILV